MWPARDFENALKGMPYYRTLCKWVLMNTSRGCANNLIKEHPDYSGSLLDYYHKDTVNFYVEQLKFASTESVTVDGIGVIIRGWGRYSYYPLDIVGCIGMLYALIDADPYVYDRNQEVGGMLMAQLQEHNPQKAEELHKIIIGQPFQMSSYAKARNQQVYSPGIRRTSASGNMTSRLNIENQFGPVYNGADSPKEDPLDAIRRYAAFKKINEGQEAVSPEPKQEAPAAPVKKKANKVQGDDKQKVIRDTLIYQHPKHKDADKRINKLFEILSKAPFEWIDIDADPDEWVALFAGEPLAFTIKWVGTQQHLWYLFSQLKKRKLVKTPKGVGIWQVVGNHFIDKDDHHFENWTKQKEPKEQKTAIDLLVDILDPVKPLAK